ncbi:esterase-like activity of phytase family protein [Auraticoccus monumenti]|uniref:glycerophosphodiester phosphodiesterase n=1 Tax=Auraticoccus monumenti TaxID=675864 RepID=A0A1G6UB56_9ACTN|nr:esterase-like activity of phytase family protein [Auraticoccus monumenti]SDD37817.1 glycerophosphoryl diester phosphodiesterase [Auraticoccus monumenti]
MPRPSTRRALTAAAVAAGLVAGLVTTTAPPAAAAPEADTVTVTGPRLTGRATLPSDHLEPGPVSGRDVTPANGVSGPFDGQPIPGFSGAVVGRGGGFWALPDNGFGTKTNSEDFLLRIYQVNPRWEEADGGRGAIQVIRHLQLRDPRNIVDFDIVNEGTRERHLTGGDFDVESIQQMADGSFWIGEEFGPFLLHVDRNGVVLSDPVSSPYGRSPQHPGLGSEAPRVRASGGFEAMAKSPDGRYLYPVMENSLVGDPDPRRRVVAEFDTRTGAYTDRTWDYRVDADANLVADAQMLADGTMLVLERDNLDGAAAWNKRIYEVDLAEAQASGALAKTLHTDLLAIDNPDLIGGDAGWGTGETYSFGFQSVETIVPLPDGQIMLVNDNNYPGNSARVPGTPDDTEMIRIDPAATSEQVANPVPVIAHRGASGYRPEHTLAAYELALRQCADVIEPDVVLTSDGVPVARHENEISGTTDVAQRAEFASRRATKTIDGAAITGWFTEDFTLAELRTLRAVERLPELRTGNTQFDGLYQVPTLAEVLDLARHSRTCTGQPVGVAPEIKHPTYFDSIGLSIEEPLLEALADAGLDDADAPVVIQSFETGNLRELARRTPLQLSQLINCSGAPYDLVAAGDERTYADLVTRDGLRQISTYADQVGFCKDVMIRRDADGTLGQPTSVVADAHRYRLTVVGWTFRAENVFLPSEFDSSADPAALGDMEGEIQAFLALGMDQLFSDQPDLAVAAVGGQQPQG